MKNTSSTFIQSSTDEEKNEFEGCKTAHTSQQDAKEKVPILNSDQWKKGNMFIVGDSILAGLREPKFSRKREIKVCCFPGGKT